MQEIEDPALASKRMRAIYEAKGYSDEWIEKRMRGIAIRAELTEEWKNREVGAEKEYSILTAGDIQGHLSPDPVGVQEVEEIKA